MERKGVGLGLGLGMEMKGKVIQGMERKFRDKHGK